MQEAENSAHGPMPESGTIAECGPIVKSERQASRHMTTLVAMEGVPAVRVNSTRRASSTGLYIKAGTCGGSHPGLAVAFSSARFLSAGKAGDCTLRVAGCYT